MNTKLRNADEKRTAYCINISSYIFNPVICVRQVYAFVTNKLHIYRKIGERKNADLIRFHLTGFDLFLQQILFSHELYFLQSLHIIYRHIQALLMVGLFFLFSFLFHFSVVFIFPGQHLYVQRAVVQIFLYAAEMEKKIGCTQYIYSSANIVCDVCTYVHIQPLGLSVSLQLLLYCWVINWKMLKGIRMISL